MAGRRKRRAHALYERNRGLGRGQGARAVDRNRLAWCPDLGGDTEAAPEVKPCCLIHTD